MVKKKRNSIGWTNRTRKAINQKWNIKESQNVKYVTLKNMRVYKSLPIICKKTAAINEQAVHLIPGHNTPLEQEGRTQEKLNMLIL
jgi:hypothetical protein